MSWNTPRELPAVPGPAGHEQVTGLNWQELTTEAPTPPQDSAVAGPPAEPGSAVAPGGEVGSQGRRSLVELALEAANVGTWSWEVATNTATWDDRYHEMYGFQPSEPRSFEVWLSRLHPADRQRLRDEVEGLLQPGAGDRWHHRFRALHPAKGDRWMEGLGRVERDHEGRAVRFAGINLDITEQARIEQALREAEAKNRRLHETMREAYASVDLTGRITETNRAFQAMVGYTAEELGRLTYVDLTPPKWHTLETEVLKAQVLERGFSEVYEKEYQRRDGTVFPIELRTFLLRDGEGQAAGMWALVRDITERKRMESALRESEERFRLFMDHSPTISWVKDEHGRHVYLSKTCQKRFGLEGKIWLGKTDFDLWGHRRAAQFRESDLAALAAEHVIETALDTTGADGDPEFWITIKFPFRDAAGNRYVGGIGLDITARKRAEQAVAEARDHLEARVVERTAELEAANRALRQSEENLRQREELTRSILATAMDGFFTLDFARDPRGAITEVNEAYCRMTGYQREELLHMHISDLEANEDPAAIAEHGRKIMAHGADRFESRHRRKDGRIIDIDSSTSRLAGSDSCTFSFVRDITDRKHTETLLEVQRDVGFRLSLTSDLETALHQLMEVVMRLEGIDCGAVYFLNPITGTLDMKVHRGISKAFAAAVTSYAADSPRTRLVKEGRPVFAAYHQLPFPLDETRRQEGLLAFALVPLSHENRVLGTMNLASHTLAEIPTPTRVVIEAAAAQASGAIARLQAEADRRRLEKQILEVSDREQARMGQEIHDGLCQQLVSLAFDAVSLEQQLTSEGRAEAVIASRLAKHLDKAITEARQLSQGLFPIRLEADGLAPALEELSRSTRERFPVSCRFLHDYPVSVANSVVATHLYRIAQEAVNNAVKHSRARDISIRLRAQADQLQLKVEDDGVGMGPEAARRKQGMGLHIMDYRARSMGGTLCFGAGKRGGTWVSCSVACPADPPPQPRGQ